MSLIYTLSKKILHFKQPAGTSRGVYTTRKIWLVHLSECDKTGVGECAPLPDLSCDALPDETYEAKLHQFCQALCETGEMDDDALRPYPSMRFGLETALLSLQSSLHSPLSTHLLFDTPFSRGEEGIPINGLVRFSFHEVELRLDANGAFKYEEALYKLELLSQYAIHSIEQPIRQGQWAYMAELCRESPLPIALDEELIGVNDPEMKSHMLNIIKPRYIILKPSLHGGMMGCREWIEIAKQQGIGSWITSALESNIGLNAIAQFASDVYGPHIRMPQGLGTGQLFTDNIPMPLEIRGDQLWR